MHLYSDGDDDHGCDEFLVMLAGTTLNYHEKGGRKELKRALSTSMELKKTEDRST